MHQQPGLSARLRQHALKRPDAPAVVSMLHNWSYDELWRRVQQAMLHIRALQWPTDTIVGLFCNNDIEHLVLCLAVDGLGLTAFSVPDYESPSTQARIALQAGITQRLRGSGACLRNDTQVLNEQIEPALDSRVLFSTSGTTGAPKLVVLSSSDLVAQAARHIQSSSERFACVATMAHNFARRHRLYCVAMGATNIFIGPAPETLVKQCQQLAVNVLHVTGFQAQQLLAMPEIDALSGVRLKTGGAPVSLDLRTALRTRVSDQLQCGYGTTETGAIAFTDVADKEAGDSVGRPLPGINVRVVDSQRHELPAGEQGELAVQCEGMFRGYLHDAERTQARLFEGWFYTGDVGRLDAQGRIHLSGRLDDMFVFNSMNIYPQEIESLLCEHPQVCEALVVPRLSATHGHVPVALVVAQKGQPLDLANLSCFARERAGLRCPRQFRQVPSLPRTTAGKVSRTLATHDASEYPDLRASIARVVRQQAPASQRALEEFACAQGDVMLNALHMDSLARMELLVMLELEFNCVLTLEELARLPGLNALVDIVKSRSAAASAAVSEITPKVEFGQQDSPATSAHAPKVVRLFWRLLPFCNCVAHLNKALETLSRRLTPEEVMMLDDWHQNAGLLPDAWPDKYHQALTHWLTHLSRLMSGSGKSAAEKYQCQRLRPTVRLFRGEGERRGKTLLVCFAVRGGHTIGVPNAVLLQHAVSSRHDVLVISEPLAHSYWFGVPYIGTSMKAIMRWLDALPWVKEYAGLRTVGSSAGGYPAVLAGCMLGASQVLSIAGRFHRPHQHPLRFVQRVFYLLQARISHENPDIALYYAEDSRRDRRFAKIVAVLSGGRAKALQFNERKVHHVLTVLGEQGALSTFMREVLFAMEDEEGTPLQSSARDTLIKDKTARQGRHAEHHGA